jgi:exopolysaccharide production protein ExoQ
VTTTLQQPTTAATDKTRSTFLLLPGSIGFLFAFRTCITLLWFQREPEQATILVAALSLVALLLAAFCAAGAIPSIPADCFHTTPIRRLSALLGLALFSLLWSSAPTVAALGYWVAWVADIATIWVVLRYGSTLHQAEAIMKGFIWGSTLVAIVAWATPPTIDLRLGNEDFMHPNALGFLFSIAIFFALYLSRYSKIWHWTALLLATTLLRTISKTSIIAFLAALAFYMLRESALSRKIKFRIGIAAALILAFLWSVLETYLTSYTESTGPETLTGRTLIWALSFEYALKTPLFGHGFYSYRFIVPSFGLFVAQQAHDELLQQFFIYGIVGVVLVISIYWAFFRQIRAAGNSGIKTLASTFLVYSLIHGIADAGTFDLAYPLWLMTMFSVLLASLNHPSLQPQQEI